MMLYRYGLILLLVTSSTVLGLAATADATTISINFGIGDNDNNTVDNNETAVNGNPHAANVSGQYWNNIELRGSLNGQPNTFTGATQGGNSLTLIDDSGLSAATLTSNGDLHANFAAVSNPSQGETGDGGLFHSALHLGGDSHPNESVTISGLTDAFTHGGYRVIAFFDIGSLDNRTYGLNVGDGLTSASYWTHDTLADSDSDGDGHIEWQLTSATTSGTAVMDANYAVFDGLSGSSFTITGLGSQGRAVLTGLQIVAVPEPSTLVLALLGGMALVILRWRRK